MKLSDFKRSGRGEQGRFVARVSDAASQAEHELTIAGPPALVKEMLADAEIDLTIDSQRTQDGLLAGVADAQAQHRRSMWELAALEDTKTLLKPGPAPPQAETSVFAAVRPVAGEGTPFALLASGFFVPAGVSFFFFFGSWVFTAVGSLIPTSGDQDLFLRMFTPTGPVVWSSTFGGRSLDFVAFTIPVFPWVPVFEVRGFTAGLCATFAAHGA